MHDLHKKTHIGTPVNSHDKSRVQKIILKGKCSPKTGGILLFCKYVPRSTSLLKRFQAEGPVRFRTEGDLALQKFEVYDEKK